MPERKFQIHISEFCGLVFTQQMAEQERILKNPDDVYEGFCNKARPIDALPAYLSERSGISFGDACDYMARAGRGGHWDGLKRVSGEVRSDITAIAQPVAACFQRDAMDELVEWYVNEYPHEAAEAGLLDSAARSTSTEVSTVHADRKAPIKRPSDDAIAAWRLRDLEGLKTQDEVVQRMSQELGKKVPQGTVSRWLTQVEKYLRDGNILPALPTPISKPQAIDPSKLDLGERTDGHTSRQRQKRAPNSD